VLDEVRELEWQFDVLDLRPVQRRLADWAEGAAGTAFTVTAAGSIRQTDLYLDTDDQRFARTAYSLRIRRRGRRRRGEATLKALAGFLLPAATSGPRPESTSTSPAGGSAAS